MTIEKLKHMAINEDVAVTNLPVDSMEYKHHHGLREAIGLAIEALEMREGPSALEQLAASGDKPQVWLSMSNGEFSTFCIRDNLIHFGNAATVEEAVRQAREVTE